MISSEPAAFTALQCGDARIETREGQKERSKGDPGKEGDCARHRPGKIEQKQKAWARDGNAGQVTVISSARRSYQCKQKNCDDIIASLKSLQCHSKIIN